MSYCLVGTGKEIYGSWLQQTECPEQQLLNIVKERTNAISIEVLSIVNPEQGLWYTISLYTKLQQ